MSKENDSKSSLIALTKLEEYWSKRPYLRLAQIVSNAWQIHPDYRRNPEPEISDIFYLTNEKFVEGLKLLEENESKDKGTTQE
jgi:hypothetical protein